MSNGTQSSRYPAGLLGPLHHRTLGTLRFLCDAGIQKLHAGITTIEKVARETAIDQSV